MTTFIRLFATLAFLFMIILTFAYGVCLLGHFNTERVEFCLKWVSIIYVVTWGIGLLLTRIERKGNDYKRIK